jgi:hypothetical protein
MAILSFRFARYSIAILKSTIEMAVCKSLMAPVLAIDSITRGLRAGAERRRPPRLKQSPEAGEVEMKPVSSTTLM